MEALEIAFAKGPQTKKVIYKEEEEEVLQCNRRLFGKVRRVKKHPFLEPAMLGINCFSFREDLQPGLHKMVWMYCKMKVLVLMVMQNVMCSGFGEI